MTSRLVEAMAIQDAFVVWFPVFNGAKAHIS